MRLNGAAAAGRASASGSPSGRRVAGKAGLTKYALDEEETSVYVSYDERILELSAQLDVERQEKILLMKKHEIVERNLNGVQTFLGGEKEAIEKIMAGARKKIALNREGWDNAMQELDIEREKNDHLVQELAIEKERNIVLSQVLSESKQREENLKNVLVRQQVRTLYHILTNLEYQRNMHFFSLWRKFTNDSQTLAAAEDLRRMTEHVDARSPAQDYVEEVVVEPYYGQHHEPSPEPESEPLDVGSLDIYAMGADLGLISHEEARTQSISPDQASPSSSSAMDRNTHAKQKSGAYSNGAMSDRSREAEGIAKRRGSVGSNGSAATKESIDASKWHNMFNSSWPGSTTPPKKQGDFGF